MNRIIKILAMGAFALNARGAMAQASGEAGAQAGANASVQSSAPNARVSENTGAGVSAKQGESSGSLAAGTAMNAQLSKPIDSKKAKAGDAIEAHTTEAVKSDGKVVIPKGAKLVGHVTRATAKSKGDADSALAVQFDRAILKDGRELPLQVTIQALASSENAAAVGGDELQPMGGMQGSTASGAAGARGTAGGVGSTVSGAASGAASTVPRTAGSAVGAVDSTAGGAANAAGRAGTGLTAGGELTSTSRGVFGMNGLSLNTGAANSTEGSLITSTGKNVHLDSGTRLLLVTQAATSVAAQR
jgi:hypothetical protein